MKGLLNKLILESSKILNVNRVHSAGGLCLGISCGKSEEIGISVHPYSKEIDVLDEGCRDVAEQLRQKYSLISGKNDWKVREFYSD